MNSRILAFPPSFLCIGAQKACTSWLNLVLKSDKNKSVFVPYLKETFYLNLLETVNGNYPVSMDALHSDIYSSFRKITESHISSELRSLEPVGISRGQCEYIEYLFRSLSCYWTGLDAAWYQNLFSLMDPGQLACDITPDYSLLQPDLIGELAEFKPDLKIILITRNPIERDLSQLRMQLLPSNPEPTEQECLDFLKQPHVRERSNYAGIIKRWRHYFSDAAIFSFDVSDIINSPGETVGRLSRFLGVPIEVENEILLRKDNVGVATWKPHQSIIRQLEEYYKTTPAGQ